MHVWILIAISVAYGPHNRAPHMVQEYVSAFTTAEACHSLQQVMAYHDTPDTSYACQPRVVLKP